MRNILNQQKTNIYVNTLTAQLPLQIPSTTDTSSTINIGGLNSYGTAGQVLKVNSSADGLEYGTDNSSNWVGDGTDLRVLNQTAYNYVELNRTDTNDVGFKLNNSSYESKLYINSDNTILKTANGKLKLEDTNSYINNSNDRLIIHSAFGEVRVGNSTEFTSVFGTRTILNEDGRTLAYYNTANNVLALGNNTDTVSLIKATLYQPKINAASGNFTYNIVSGTLSASRNITLPGLAADDTFVFASQSQQLKNKQLLDTNNLNMIGETLTEISIGNTTNVVKILNVSSMKNSGNKPLLDFNTSTQILTIGNLTDTIALQNATGDLTGNASTASKILTINNSDIVQLTGSQTLTDKTLTLPKINDTSSNHTYNIIPSELTANRDLTIPLLLDNDDIVCANVVQTLLSKTLKAPVIKNTLNRNLFVNTDPSLGGIDNITIGNSTDLVEIINPTLSNFKINDASLDHQYIITPSELTSNYNVILPVITDTDTFCFTDVAQTLLSKTLVSPTITGTGNIAGSFTGNLTGNADTATKIATIINSNIVQLTGSQTLTDKTLTSPTITGTVTASPLTISGTVVASSDTDSVSTFGRAKVGYMGWNDFAGFAHLDSTNTTDYALLHYATGTTYLNASSTDGIYFAINNQYKMKLVSSTGNFGINNLSPSEKLEVNGNIKLSGTVVASSDTDTVSTFGRAKIGNMGYTDFAGFAHLDSATQQNYALLQFATGATYLNTSTTDGIYFAVNNQYKMKLVSSTGNFGINQLSPSEKLDVVGNIKASGTITPGSDDRIKYGEMPITDALSTIKKINTYTYRKATSLDEADSPNLNVELGIVAQELYNRVPELRHMVCFDKTMPRNFVDGNLDGNCVNDIYGYCIKSRNNPFETEVEDETKTEDETEAATEIVEEPVIVAVNYNSFHALNIKAIQELCERVEKLEKIINDLQN